MFIFSIIYIWLLFELLTTTEINTNSSVNLIPFEEILRYDIGSKMFMFNVDHVMCTQNISCMVSEMYQLNHM